MLKKVFALILCLLVISPFASQASLSAAPPPEFSELIVKAGDLAQKGEWDRSEILFLKAVESPAADHRIQAYEGLTSLYTKLRLARKAGRAKKRLEEEKQFISKLIPQEENYYETYTLLEGDTYAKIAARKKISLEWLKRANSERPLRTGNKIRVPRFSYSLIVSKENKTMEWRRGEEVLKVYPIAVGKKETGTPAGEFEIVSKVKDPIWYHLKVKIPPESPDNLLGPRWLGLNVKGYGIHGTRDPKSIRFASSHGCVRMYNRDVQELFEWIPIGTKVSIRDSH